MPVSVLKARCMEADSTQFMKCLVHSHKAGSSHEALESCQGLAPALKGLPVAQGSARAFPGAEAQRMLWALVPAEQARVELLSAREEEVIGPFEYRVKNGLT